MKSFALAFLLAVLAALSTGCAGQSTSVADAETGKLCRDGAVLPPDGGCASHGGLRASR